MNAPLKFFMGLAKAQAVLTRKFDGKLGGLGLSEFMILYQLSQAKDQKLRRVDLAEQVGLTASGVTRVLLPMEKVHLVKREVNPSDARVSFVTIAPGGREKLTEGLERAELFSEELLPKADKKELEKFGSLLESLS